MDTQLWLLIYNSVQLKRDIATVFIQSTEALCNSDKETSIENVAVLTAKMVSFHPDISEIISGKSSFIYDLQ